MLRWILLLLALVGLAVTFTTKSAGLLGLGLLLGLVGGIGFALAMAADRVAANTRPDSAMASVEDLAALGKARPAARTPPIAARDESRH